jgi:hypothetical protein
MKRARLHLVAVALTASILSCTGAYAWARDPALPNRAPVPTMLPMEQFGPPLPPAGGTPPIPTPRPEATDTTDPATPSPAQAQTPDGQAEPPAEKEPKYLADERSGIVPAKTLPAEEVACRKRLETLGAEFRNETALSSADGCSLPYPVSLRSFGSGIALDPPATMDCAMAEAASRFVAGPVQTSVKAAYGKGVKSIGQASAYVCRPRNGTVKLSEHAFGNALDIAALTLDDGTVLTVGDEKDARATSVLAEIRKAACGPFKTVLGPGSDADHATHLHLDLAPRRNGGLYCH